MNLKTQAVLTGKKKKGCINSSIRFEWSSVQICFLSRLLVATDLTLVTGDKVGVGEPAEGIKL